MNDIDTFNNLREAILNRVTAQETTIREAWFEERERFDGSPAVVIGVSQNEALYNSQKVDKVTFVFSLRIYIPVPSLSTSGTDAHDTEINMGRAYWQVFSMFNQRGVLNPHCDIVEPLPSIWGWEERADGILRFSEINLRCVKFVSNSPYVAAA